MAFTAAFAQERFHYSGVWLIKKYEYKTKEIYQKSYS